MIPIPVETVVNTGHERDEYAVAASRAIAVAILPHLYTYRCIITPLSPKSRFQMFIEPEQLKRLRQLQTATGARVAELIRRAIGRYLDDELPVRKRQHGKADTTDSSRRNRPRKES